MAKIEKLKEEMGYGLASMCEPAPLLQYVSNTGPSLMLFKTLVIPQNHLVLGGLTP